MNCHVTKSIARVFSQSNNYIGVVVTEKAKSFKIFYNICGYPLEKCQNLHIPPGKKISKPLGKFLLYTLSSGVDVLKSVFYPSENSE